MFENFTFDQRKVILAEDGTDPEPRLSPKDVPVEWNSPLARPLMTRPTFNQDNHHSSESIDTLVQQMSRQTLLPYRRSDGSRAVRHIHEPYSNWASATSQTPMHPVPLPHTWHQTSLAPMYAGGVGQAPPLRNLHSAPTGSPNTPADLPVCRASLSPSPSPLDPKPHGTAANPRAIREALMEIMITKGVQCKVQAPAPLTPVSASEPTSPRIEALKAQGSSDHTMSGADRSLGPLEPLEVDGKFGVKEEEAFLKSLVSLRQAATPGGIRRSSGLRFSSSAEMASKAQNLKRNKIKMRKRDNKGKLAKLPQAQEPMQMPTPPPEDAASPLASM